MSEEQKFDLSAVEGELKKAAQFIQTTPKLQTMREGVRGKLGQTPKDLLFKQHSVSVYRYRRETPATIKTPLLLVYSLVNRAYVMDLLPGESFVQAMLDRGMDVYLLDWGEPNAAQKDLSLQYYLREYLGRAVRRVRKDAGSEKVNLAGYCLGGNLALLYAAIDGGKQVKNLITMVTPANFKDAGLLSWWAEEEHFDVDKIVDSHGNVPASFFAQAFPWLVPTADLKKARAIYEFHDNEAFMTSFLALDIWGKENTDFPGEVYREIIKTGYQKNALVKTRAWPFSDGGQALMTNVSMPVLNLAAEFDHVSPSASCLELGKLTLSSDCTNKTYPTGHLGIAQGKDVMGQHTDLYWDEIRSWLVERD